MRDLSRPPPRPLGATIGPRGPAAACHREAPGRATGPRAEVALTDRHRVSRSCESVSTLGGVANWHDAAAVGVASASDLIAVRSAHAGGFTGRRA